jgi:hypothetical protein
MPYTPRPPVAGRRFATACKYPGELRPTDRKLMALIGAFADGGEHSPPVKVLAARLDTTPAEIDAALERLAKRRLLWVDWAPYRRYGDATHPHARRLRNRYTCRYAGDPLTDRAKRILGEPA